MVIAGKVVGEYWLLLDNKNDIIAGECTQLRKVLSWLALASVGRCFFHHIAGVKICQFENKQATVQIICGADKGCC